MGPVERFVRRALNLISTGLTRWWLGVGLRRVPTRTGPPSAFPPTGGPRPMVCVPSPGDWVVPAGQRPGWSWLPEQGALPNLRAMPRWVRVWYRTPFIDRYAYAWMWWHGGWAVPVDSEAPEPPPDGGVREPRRPLPKAPDGFAYRVEPGSGQD